MKNTDSKTPAHFITFAIMNKHFHNKALLFFSLLVFASLICKAGCFVEKTNAAREKRSAVLSLQSSPNSELEGIASVAYAAGYGSAQKNISLFYFSAVADLYKCPFSGYILRIRYFSWTRSYLSYIYPFHNFW